MSSIKTNRNNYSMLNNTYGGSLPCRKCLYPSKCILNSKNHMVCKPPIPHISKDIREDLGSFSLQAAVRSTCIDPYTNIPGVS